MTFRIHKTAPQGLSIVEASGLSLQEAEVYLDSTKSSYGLAEDGIECDYSADRRSLTCSHPDAFGFKAIYRIEGPASAAAILRIAPSEFIILALLCSSALCLLATALVSF